MIWGLDLEKNFSLNELSLQMEMNLQWLHMLPIRRNLSTEAANVNAK